MWSWLISQICRQSLSCVTNDLKIIIISSDSSPSLCVCNKVMGGSKMDDTHICKF